MCMPKAPDTSAQRAEAERQKQAEAERKRKDKMDRLDQRKSAAAGAQSASLANFAATGDGLRSFFAPTGGA